MGGRVRRKGGRSRGSFLGVAKALILAVFLIAVLPVFMVWAAEGTTVEERAQGIEQVYTNMPEITVYGYGLDLADGGNAAAYLGTEELVWQNTGSFGTSGEGIGFFVLLDISGSIPKSYFKEIKDGILKLQEELGENDRLVLSTFGEEVKILADGSQKPEELKLLLDTVENHDQRTLLFEAVDRIGAVAAKVTPEECKRRIMVVISDGEDIAVGKKMAAEAQETLKEYGIPVYGMCIRDTDRNNINSFGEFSRMSGGELTTFGAKEGGTILTDLYDRLYSYTVLQFLGASNRVTNEYEMFALKINGGQDTITRQVLNSRWIPDKTPPAIVNVGQMGARQLRISFSEPVTGLADVSNYIVAQGEDSITVSGAALEPGSEQSVVLTMETDLSPGTYTVTCNHMTDQSMEKNPLTGAAEFQVEKDEAADRDRLARGLGDSNNRSDSGDNAGVWFLIFLALVALIIVVAVKKKQTEKSDEAGGRQEVDKRLEKDLKTSLEVVVRMGGELPKKVHWEIDKSLIIGRADTCDIIFDDPRMSRQHCVLEWNGTALFINDLSSRNGTFADGKRINVKTELGQESMVKAGSVEMTIRW